MCAANVETLNSAEDPFWKRSSFVVTKKKFRAKKQPGVTTPPLGDPSGDERTAFGSRDLCAEPWHVICLPPETCLRDHSPASKRRPFVARPSSEELQGPNNPSLQETYRQNNKEIPATGNAEVYPLTNQEATCCAVAWKKGERGSTSFRTL